ncbi:MAG: patatin-like phospholipase family protein [Bacteroidales bacterium]|nr:MAG: patatin-like phospholipase family protein [Bacteroidales bacterium]
MPSGLYHIGVIRALEENGIPIDYISGTSMGAIVAALYASGYSPEQMVSIVASGDVEQWVSGRIDDKYRFYYTERSDAPTMLSIYADMKRDSVSNKNSMSLALPHAFINTAQIDLALTGLFAPASTACGGDFDRLMVPFRCVATDMNGHRAVEFSKGDLPFVVRASMAYPLAFRPVTSEDGTVLVDGGCYNNFPWQVLVEDFAPDFLIGSQCVGDDEYATQDSSVEQQVMALITSPTDYALPPERSVLIKREVDAGILDFAAGMEIIEQGYEDAHGHDAGASGAARRTAYAGRGGGASSGLPRPVSRAGDQRLHDRGSAQTPELLCPYVHALRRAPGQRRRTLGSVRFRRGEGELLLSDGHRRVHGECLSVGALRLRPAQLRPDLLPREQASVAVPCGGNISSTAFNQAYVGFNYFSVGRTAQYAHGDLYLSPVSAMASVGGRTVILKRRPMYVDYEMDLSHRTTLHGSFGNITPVRNSIEARTNEIFFHTAFGVAMTRKSIVEASVNTGFNYYGYQADYDPYDTPHTHDRFRFVAGRVALERSTLDKVIYPTRGTRLSISGIAVHGRDTYENAATRLSGRRGQEAAYVVRGARSSGSTIRATGVVRGSRWGIISRPYIRTTRASATPSRRSSRRRATPPPRTRR